MQSCTLILKNEFAEQLHMMQSANEIVLYGKTVLTSIMETALDELGVELPRRIFERGRFIDEGSSVFGDSKVVFLCGMRAKTRESMKRDASHFFSNASCFDVFAIYFEWLTKYVNRNCNHEELAQTIIDVRNEKTIHNIDSINTSYCNLNCKECSNGMQYRKDKKIIPVDRHILSIKQLTDVLPVSYCNIQGGEPLLDSCLVERLLLHAKNAKIAFITLATNGTILPSNKVLQAIRDSGIMLRISDYGKLSIKKEMLIQKAKEFLIPCDIYTRSLSWVSYGDFKAHGRTGEMNSNIANNCHFGTKDLMLYDGKLYCCCRTLFANAIGKENEAVIANVLNVLEKFNRRDLEKIIFGRELNRMCDYCDFPMTTIDVAEQVPRNKF